MVIFYDSEGNIIQAEHNTNELVFNEEEFTLEGIKAEYAEKGISIVALDMELDGGIFDYKVLLDEEGKYKGLYPKGVDD